MWREDNKMGMESACQRRYDSKGKDVLFLRLWSLGVFMGASKAGDGLLNRC